MPRALPNHCQRCGEKTNTTTGSYFDESIICMRCNQIERKHPDFTRAQEAETAQVRAGNYNYPGIGLPEGLLQQCQQARRDTQAELDTAQALLVTN